MATPHYGMETPPIGARLTPGGSVAQHVRVETAIVVGWCGPECHVAEILEDEMRMRIGIVGLALAALLVAGAPVAAGPLTGLDVPSNLLVLSGGLEWAWASPCAPEEPSCGEPLEMHHGFRVAETADWLAGFTDLNAVLIAFNPAGSAVVRLRLL